jgi:hypothetical protein
VLAFFIQQDQESIAGGKWDFDLAPEQSCAAQTAHVSALMTLVRAFGPDHLNMLEAFLQLIACILLQALQFFMSVCRTVLAQSSCSIQKIQKINKKRNAFEQYPSQLQEGKFNFYWEALAKNVLLVIITIQIRLSLRIHRLV